MTDDTAQIAPEDKQALEAARDLIAAGIPVFVAPACHLGCWAHPGGTGSSGTGFDFPRDWQSTQADPQVVDNWRSGDALGAVMGHGLDLVDVDPHNGGAATLDGMHAAGIMPLVYAEAATPSGGRHYFVASMDVRSRDAIRPGVDIKAGTADGGAGFAFIAPTVKRSKTTGELTPYRWIQTLDVETFADERAGDRSGDELAEAVRVAHGHTTPRSRDDASARLPGDPFGDPAPDRRAFTLDQALAFVRPHIDALARARDGSIRTSLLAAALAGTHFGPEFWTKDQYLDQLAAALGQTVYDGRTWRAIDAVEGCYRDAAGGGPAFWRATLRQQREPETEPSPDAGAEPSSVDLLIAEMLTADALQDQPNPKPLINGILDMNTTAWIIGKAGSFKSFVVLDMAGHIATDKEWQGRATNNGLVVMIVAEGVAGTKLRLAAWEKTYGPIGDRILFLPRPVQSKNAGAWQVLVEALRFLQPVFVVIDTQSRVTIGLNENDNAEMMIYVNAADAIRRATGACVLSVHHQGRAGTDARGASSIDGAQDAELRIERRGNDQHVTIHLDKQKDADDQGTIALDLARVEGGTDPVTGRDLSSLVVWPDAIRREIPKPWLDELPVNQLAIVDTMAEHFIDVGGTKSEVRRTRIQLAEMQNGSWQRAWNSLVSKGILVKIKGTQRYVLASMVPDE